MLLHHDGDGVVCIGQAAHSWVSGQLARRWGNDSVPPPEPLAEVCLGAEQHDIGMSDWDRRPELDPETGYPTSFLDLPLATHIALWTDAPDKILAQSPYAALLVSLHGHALFRERRPTPEIERYLRGQEELQRDLRERMGEDEARARRNQQLVWAVDHLALVGLFPEWTPDEVTVDDTTYRSTTLGPQRVGVAPWPFHEPEITLAYPGRRLTRRSATADELHAHLAAAPWVDVRVTWERAGS
jgi:hypothetical protein